MKRIGDDPLGVAVAGAAVYVAFGTSQTLRVVSPTPGSLAVDLGTAPRSMLAVGGAVWVAGANPGQVLSVSLPGARPVHGG